MHILWSAWTYYLLQQHHKNNWEIKFAYTNWLETEYCRKIVARIENYEQFG